MVPFQYFRAKDTDRALELLRQPGAKALAGGTTLIDLMKLGVESASCLVDIQDLPWKGIGLESSMMYIGSLCSNTYVADHPLVVEYFPFISQAILSGASGQIRNMATVGGNIMQRTRCGYFRSVDFACNKRTPGSGCAAMSGHHGLHAVLGVSDACFAVYPSDLAVALIAADACIVLMSREGERTMPLAEFLLPPESTPHRETRLQQGELIKAIAVPLSSAPYKCAYLKLRGRASFEFATVSVGAAIRMEGSTVASAAVALGGIGTVPWRSKVAEEQLVGCELSVGSLQVFCDTLFAEAAPRDANRYKLRMARGAVTRVIRELAQC